jgi:hypothetical protein
MPEVAPVTSAVCPVRSAAVVDAMLVLIRFSSQAVV